MDSDEKDLTMFLEYYVCRESDKEKMFIRDQQQSQLQLCITANHSNCPSTNQGGDLLMIQTKLLQLNHENKNEFYIKSQKVSHCTGLTNHNNAGDHKLMTIETVIRKVGSECETIFMTFVAKSEKGKRLTTHRSFTREIIDCQHLDALVNKYDFKAVFSDNENSQEHKSKPKKKSSRDKALKKPSLKSNTLLKLWKGKSFFGKTDESKYASAIKPILGNRKLSVACMQNFSTEFNSTTDKMPKNIQAKISVSNKTQLFEIIEDDDLYMDEENDYDNYGKSDSDLPQTSPDSDSYMKFNLPICNESDREKVDFLKGATCDCELRRYSIMTKYIEWRLKRSSKFNEEILNKFNEQTRHFSDCQKLYSGTPNSNPTSGFSSSLNSVFLDDSLNNNTQFLKPEYNIEKARKLSFVESASNLDKIIDDMKKFNEIQCSIKHVNYFKNLTTYEHFEKTLSSLIGSTISAENLSLFLFMIRSTIQHIDDSNSKNKEIIKNIMDFSTKFLIKFYAESARTLGGIDNFIRRDDVD